MDGTLRRRLAVWGLGGVVLGCLAAAHPAVEPRVKAHPAVEVQVRPTVVPAHGSIEVRVSIDPDQANREVHLLVEGASFYTSSAFELDGERAARTYRRLLPDLPEGEYEATAVVTRADGKRLRAAAGFLVVDSR